MESETCLKWPGICFDNLGKDWVCRICGLVANYRSREVLRKSVRKRHTVSRCAEGLLTEGEEAKEEAIAKARNVGQKYLKLFLDTLRPPVLASIASEDLPGNVASARSRSRSPVNHARIKDPAAAMTDLCGCRVAKLFNNEVHFGFVRERIRGAVVEANSSGTKEFQAVWKIEYDDGDFQQLNRIEILAALRLYRKHRKADTVVLELVDPDDHDADEDDNFNDEADDPGMLSTGSHFLDPRYNLLQLLTPTATQNRLSYLVELVLDKSQKQISNEAIKLRLRKDAAAFGAEDMPIDVRGIARYLGARTMAEIRRHRCGNTECSYAWVGAVASSNFNPEDMCPDCGTPRYKRVGSILKPQRVFYYFGAKQVVESLHKNPVFKANWKKNMDITLNAYRSSPDAYRLGEATYGEALAEHNGRRVSIPQFQDTIHYRCN